MSTALQDIGMAWSTKNQTIYSPGTGNAFNQSGKAFGLAVVGAGTFKLPDNGLPMFIHASGGTGVITNIAGTTIATLDDGQSCLVIPTSATTWTATLFIVGVT